MYCFCTKFGQLILGKIIETVATMCQILRLKCTKIQVQGGGKARERGREVLWSTKNP